MAWAESDPTSRDFWGNEFLIWLWHTLQNDGDTIALNNTGTEPLDALLLCARPVREPMVRYGPFVMNTIAEIQQAFDDFDVARRCGDGSGHHRAWCLGENGPFTEEGEGQRRDAREPAAGTHRAPRFRDLP